MLENRYEPDYYKQWAGTVSQCYSCKAKGCYRNQFKTNSSGGKEIAFNNPGVVYTVWLCKNWEE